MTDVDAPDDAPPRAGGRRSRRVLLIMLGLVSALVLAMAGGALWVKNEIEGSVQTLGNPFKALPTRAPEPVTPQGEPDRDPARNILILGSDSRISAGDPSQWSYGAQRTDAIMLLHLPGDGKGAYVVSIPRDSWVPIPGAGTAKINAAFSYGGPTLTIQTIEQLTGVRIDHFAVADFESFVGLTDAVGGVVLNGQLLNGEQALDYARERYNLPGGDFDRIKRQQAWARALASSAVASEARRDPTKVLGLVSAVSNAVAVDDGLSLPTMLDLAMDLRGLKPKDVTFITVPVLGTGWSPDGTQSIVNLDFDDAEALFEAIATDDMAAYVAENAEQLNILGETVR